jgi:alcohol dehydrogenase class IV
LPRATTASTGLDALTQLIEPWVSPRANPITDALCRDAIPRVARALPLACQDGHNAEAREEMALGALLGGLALANAGLGAVHGLANPIGGMFPVPHGVICAALLAPVMEANWNALRLRETNSASIPRYKALGRLLTGRPEATPMDGAAWVRQLVSGLRIPGLGQFGVTAKHTDELVEKALRASSMKANPVALTHGELAGILARAM